MIDKIFRIDNNQINLRAKVVDNNDILKHMDYDFFTGLCKEGCQHYNKSWSCPPNSPKFSDYSRNHKKSLVVILCSELGIDGIDKVHKNLRNNITPILDKLESEFSGLKTDGGRCLICKECAYTENKKCYHPNLLRHSMEAMGINLDTLSREILNHNITWDSDKNSNCTVFGSVLFNGDISEKEFDIFIEKILGTHI